LAIRSSVLKGEGKNPAEGGRMAGDKPSFSPTKVKKKIRVHSPTYASMYPTETEKGQKKKRGGGMGGSEGIMCAAIFLNAASLLKGEEGSEWG